MESCWRIVCRLHSLAMLPFVGYTALALLFAGFLHAQSTNASLTGRITDSSKAVMPNAKVNGQTRFATTAGSYVCANDKRLHFGLGAAEKARVEIHWPSGVKQVVSDIRSDQFLEVREPER